MVIGIRLRIVEEMDKDKDSGDEDEDMMEDDRIRREAAKLKGPSAEAVGKFEDYRKWTPLRSFWLFSDESFQSSHMSPTSKQMQLRRIRTSNFFAD